MTAAHTTVTVSADDLRTVLEQRVTHWHRVPGVWDPDNGRKAGIECEECAARERLRSALRSAKARLRAARAEGGAP